MPLHPPNPNFMHSGPNACSVWQVHSRMRRAMHGLKGCKNGKEKEQDRAPHRVPKTRKGKTTYREKRTETNKGTKTLWALRRTLGPKTGPKDQSGAQGKHTAKTGEEGRGRNGRRPRRRNLVLRFGLLFPRFLPYGSRREMLVQEFPEENSLSSFCARNLKR